MHVKCTFILFTKYVSTTTMSGTELDVGNKAEEKVM